MKNSLKYLKLWQKKRSGLPVDDDQQKDWLEMHGLLDQHMPVSTPLPDDKPSRSKGFKLLSVLFVSLSAAAMSYVVSHVVELRKHHKQSFSYHQKHKTGLIDSITNTRDSIANARNTSDSLTANGISIQSKDSLAALQPVTAQNAKLVTPGFNEKSTSTPSPGTIAGKAAALDKKNNLLSTSSQNKKRQAPINSNSNKLVRASATGNKSNAGNLHGYGKSGHTQGAITHHSLFQPGDLNRPSNQNGVNDKQYLSAKADSSNMQYPSLFSPAPNLSFNTGTNNFQVFAAPGLSFTSIQKQASNKSKDNKKTNRNEKTAKSKNQSIKNSTPLNLDWGILTGVNTSGSFTPKGQNSNFYGSSPVDTFFGLFANYNLNDKWAVGSQIRLFNPQTISTTYTHANGSKIDSAQSLKITSSRKLYSVSIPIRVMYKVNNNISFVGGPVINIPVKQHNANTTLQPAAIKSDSTYYAKVDSVLNGTQYLQKLNVGLSAGVNIQFKRLSFEAVYLKSLSGYQVTSGYGAYRSYNGTLQFTIGFRLNKLKP
jgi:hypothetical protein